MFYKIIDFLAKHLQGIADAEDRAVARMFKDKNQDDSNES
jgi:hypothetical protein